MIRRKSDIPHIIKNFEEFSKKEGNKYYITFETENPIGTITLMKYQDGNFTYHRKNELYWDIKEIQMDSGILIDVMWGFRKSINRFIKSTAEIIDINSEIIHN